MKRISRKDAESQSFDQKNNHISDIRYFKFSLN